MTASEQRAWAAGVLEGEGCFRAKTNPSRPGYRPVLVVNLSSTDRDVIERVCATFPGHGRVSERQPANPAHKRQYAVEWYSAAAEALMREVQPMLCARRAAKIAECLATPGLSHQQPQRGGRAEHYGGGE